MATPLSEGVSAVLGAAAAGGTSGEDEHCHVQRARGYTHSRDIMGTIIGGSTNASLMHMVGEGSLVRYSLEAPRVGRSDVGISSYRASRELIRNQVT